MCNTGADFAGFVGLCALGEGFSRGLEKLKEKAFKTWPRNKKGFIRIGGWSDTEDLSWTPHGYKHFPNKNQSWNDIVKSTKSGPAKYSFDIKDIEQFEREAWATGTPVSNGKDWRVNSFNSVIGAANGQETVYVRIEKSANTIHGHPITEAEYNKLLFGH